MRSASTWRRRWLGRAAALARDRRGPAGETGEIVADPAAWGDVILGRKETPTSYHLSVVVDDALQGVTHVVRGQDLFWSTSVHRAAAGAARPAGAGLSPSPADPRCRRPQAVQVDAGHRPARAARGRARRRRISAGWLASPRSCQAARRAMLDARAGAGGLDAEGQTQESCEQRRASAGASAARASRAIEIALAGLAHDIRTPLTGILALARTAACLRSARARAAAGPRRSGARPSIWRG